jgi:hypothetical protein
VCKSTGKITPKKPRKKQPAGGGGGGRTDADVDDAYRRGYTEAYADGIKAGVAEGYDIAHAAGIKDGIAKERARAAAAAVQEAQSESTSGFLTNLGLVHAKE